MKRIFTIFALLALVSPGLATITSSPGNVAPGQTLISPILTDNHSKLQFDGSGGLNFYDSAATPTWFGDYFVNSVTWNGLDPSGYRNPALVGIKWGNTSSMQRKDFQENAVTDYQFMHGGSGAALGDLPADPRDGELAIQTPPIAFTSWHNPSGSIVSNYVGWTNIMYQLTTNGALAAITNAGGTFWLVDDNGAQMIGTNRTGAGYLSSIYSNLDIDLVNYPQGTNWTGLVHSNGFKWVSTLSARAMPGNKNPLWTNSVAINGHSFFPESSPETFQRDITKCYDFGVDGVRYADPTTAAGFHIQTTRMVHESIMMPFYTAKFPYGVTTDQSGQGRRTPIAYFHMGGKISRFPNAVAWRAVNALDYDDYTSTDWPGGLGSADWQIDLTDRILALYDYNAPFLGKGHYHISAPFNSTLGEVALTNTQFGLTANAMLLSGVLLSYDWTTQPNTWYPNLFSSITNKTWLRVEMDPFCERPYTIQRNGATNVLVMYRRLKGGAFAVGLFNPTVNTTNITISLDAIGAITNQTYNFFSAWDNSGAGTNRGNAANTFTFTNLQAKCAGLLYVTPAQGAWQRIQLPFLSATNNTGTNMLVTTLGPGTYDFRGTISGRTASGTVSPAIYVFLTNSTAAFNGCVSMQLTGTSDPGLDPGRYFGSANISLSQFQGTADPASNCSTLLYGQGSSKELIAFGQGTFVLTASAELHVWVFATGSDAVNAVTSSTNNWLVIEGPR